MHAIFRNRKLWKRVFQILTWLLILAFISHPELRLLVPLLDSLGLELLLGLAGLQLLDVYRERVAPCAALFVRRVFHPAVIAMADAFDHGTTRPLGRVLWNLLLTGSGYIGTALAFTLAGVHRAARRTAG